jgi:cyclopropane-fatty-acyl-phospholipid synthase
MVRVAVIGSGIAGLAAASNLVESGHEVTVYEADAHIGGHACTQQVKYGKPSPQSSASSAPSEMKRSTATSTATGATSNDTVDDHDEATYGADIGFQVFNQVTYPNMLSWFDRYGVTLEKSDMSLAVAMPGGPEWSSNGINGVFADRCNLLNPKFYRMIYEMTKFEKQVLAHLANERRDHSLTLGQFLKMHGYSIYFRGITHSLTSIY